jgi:hypothetical protein
LNAAADEVLSLKTNSIVLDNSYVKNKNTPKHSQKSPPQSPAVLTLRQHHTQQAQHNLERQISPKIRK